MPNIKSKSAIEIVKSIIISLDDEDFAFREGGELEAWADLWNAMTPKQRAEVESGLPHCYKDYDDEERPGALQQLKRYAETGVNIRQHG